MDAEGSVNGGSKPLFGETISSLREHINYTVKPHVDDVLRSVTALARAEQENLALHLAPAGEAAKKTSVLLGAVLGCGLLAAVFTGCALVAIVLLTAPEELQVPLLCGIAGILIAATCGIAFALVRAARDIGARLSEAVAHYTEEK